MITFDDPDRLQEEGEVCESCRLFWENQSVEPIRMVSLGDEDGEVLKTEHHHIPIVVCAYCDGPMT